MNEPFLIFSSRKNLKRYAPVLGECDIIKLRQIKYEEKWSDLQIIRTSSYKPAHFNQESG